MPEDFTAPPLAPVRVWDRGDPRPVLAVHCSLAHAGAWSGLVERLHGLTLTAMDLPGHGRAPDWDGIADLQDLATRDAIALAEAQGRPVDLFGHSFGATVCLRIALERPDLVRSLVLVEPVLFAAARSHAAFAGFQARHEAVAAAMATNRAEAAALFHADWGNGESLADLPDRQRHYIIDRIHHIAAQSAALVDDRAGLTRPGGLEAVAVPVLLIEGSESPAIIEAIQGVLAARLPLASRLIVPGAGHMVPITHPHLIAPAIQAHLDAA